MDFSCLWEDRSFADTDVLLSLPATADTPQRVLHTERLHKVTLMGASEKWKTSIAYNIEREQPASVVIFSEYGATDEEAVSVGSALLESLYRNRLPRAWTASEHMRSVADLLTLANQELCLVVVDMCVEWLERFVDAIDDVPVNDKTFEDAIVSLSKVDEILDTTCYANIKETFNRITVTIVSPFCSRDEFWGKPAYVELLGFAPLWVQQRVLRYCARHIMETTIDLNRVHPELKDILGTIRISLRMVRSLKERHFLAIHPRGSAREAFQTNIWKFLAQRYGDVDKVLSDEALIAECRPLFGPPNNGYMLEKLWTEYAGRLRYNHSNSLIAMMHTLNIRSSATSLPEMVCLSDLTASCIQHDLKKVVTGGMPYRILNAWATNAPSLDAGLVREMASSVQDVTAEVRCGTCYVRSSKLFLGVRWVLSYYPGTKLVYVNIGDDYGESLTVRLRLWNVLTAVEFDQDLRSTMIAARQISLSTADFTHASLHVSIKPACASVAA